VQQQIETGAPAGASRFRLGTRTVSISHDFRVNKSWANTFGARLNSSRETRTDAETDRGLNLDDQLRFSFKRGSATGFVNYTHQKESLAGLIARNPQLLPPLLQRTFAADPALFLQMNRDQLAALLSGVELPQTRGIDAGLRLQAAFSRMSVSGEVRYSSNEFQARNQRIVVASIGMNIRLDAANSVQINGSRPFGFNATYDRSALTISYVHHFGAGSGGGLQFSRLLGLDRGQIQGRVFYDLNGNGQDDPNEPGVPGIKVQLNGGQSAPTDDSGHFRFQMNSGAYNIAVTSADLGVRWRASTMTEQHGSLSARQTINVSFGLNDYGSVAGRVFNDVSQKGEHPAGSLPGIGGVRLTLRPMNAADATHSVIVDGSGVYQFRNVPPGSYTLEIDPATLPADFRVPPRSSWVVTVKPLQTFFLDVPLSAQRALYGVVFVDKDGDGKFDPEKDQPVEGARVTAGKTEVITGKGGRYILRNLPSGRMEVRARAPWGTESGIIIIDLAEGPIRGMGINLAIGKQP
jgi:hypothetical protein